MKLFSEKVEPTFTSSNLNILTVKEFTEIFFDVFEFEINGKKFIAEKVSNYKNFPVVEVPLVLEGKELTAPFVLQKGKFEILFNPDIATIVGNVSEEVDEPLIDISEKEEDVEGIILEKKETILHEIAQAKQTAVKYAEQLKQQKLREAKEYFSNKQKVFNEELDKSKKDMLHEFLSLVENVKSEVFSFTEHEKDKLNKFISNSIENLSEKLSKSIDNKQELAEEKFSDQIDDLANKILSGVLLKEISINNEKSVKDINTRFESITKSLESLVDKKNNILKDSVSNAVKNFSNTISTLEKANVEINDQINKTGNRALSRIGNVKTQLEVSITEATNNLISKIETVESRIKDYYDTKIALVDEKVVDLTNENKSYFISLINESKQSLLNEISNIKVDVPNIIVEKSNGKQEVDLKGIKAELEKIIGTRFSNELQSLKRLIELSSGGGSVAKQFANGGTMNGNLTVVGTISAQSYAGIPNPDLSLYLPLSGGTITGDLSVAGLLSANRIGFNTSAGLTAGVGQLTWNDTDGTLDLGLKGGNVTLQIGQEHVVRVVNKTGSDLLESQYSVVRIRTSADQPPGAQGQRLAIVLAQGNNDPNSVDTLGLVTENISNNQEGFITTSGLVRNIDTTGSLQGESWADGDVLYLSPSTPGVLTKFKPQAPNHTVVVGFVVYAHSNQGKIFVKVDNGYELDELHNVRITSISGNDVLKYNSVDGVWENSNTLNLSSLSATRIYTNQLDALSANISIIDIKQYELSGFNVQGDATVQGSISATGNLTVDTNTLYVDSVNNRVGIGTASPSKPLHVNGQSLFEGAVFFGPSSSIGLFTWGNDDFFVKGVAGKRLNLNANNASGQVVISTNGNVGIGTSTPSYKLDVNGDANISTSLTVGTSLDVGGHFSAVTKSFLIDNPTKEGKKLQYGVVESNQHSVFVRGKTSDSIITLPKEWVWLVHKDSVTVQLTPVGAYQQLYVVSQNNKQVVVGGVDGEYNYTIYGERKDVAKLETEV